MRGSKVQGAASARLPRSKVLSVRGSVRARAGSCTRLQVKRSRQRWQRNRRQQTTSATARCALATAPSKAAPLELRHLAEGLCQSPASVALMVRASQLGPTPDSLIAAMQHQNSSWRRNFNGGEDRRKQGALNRSFACVCAAAFCTLLLSHRGQQSSS